jgi:hypothetical protein
MSQLPAAQTGFLAALETANQGIATASANQRAKLEARMRAAEIRQRGQIARLQADLEAERISAQSDLGQQELQQRREESEGQQKLQKQMMQQRQQEAEESRRFEAIMFDRQARLQLGIEEAKRRRIQAVQAGLHEEAAAEKQRSDELNFQLRDERRKQATLQALTSGMRGQLFDNTGKFKEALETREQSLRAVADATGKSVAVGMSTGLKGMVLDSVAYREWVQEGKLSSFGPAMREAASRTVQSTRLEGVVPKEQMVEFKQEMGRFMGAMGQLWISTVGEQVASGVVLPSGERQAFVGQARGGLDVEELKKEAGLSLTRMRKMANGDTVLGTTLQAIADNAARVVENRETAFLTVDDPLLSVGEGGSDKRFLNLAAMMRAMAEVPDAISLLDGVRVVGDDGQEVTLGSEQAPLLDIENFKISETSRILPEVVAALKAQLPDSEVRRLLGHISDPSGELGMRVDAILAKRGEFREEVAAERGIPLEELPGGDLDELIQLQKETGLSIEDLERQQMGTGAGALGRVAEILGGMAGEELEFEDVLPTTTIEDLAEGGL